MDPAICNDYASSTDAVVIPSLSDVNNSTEDPEVDVTGFHQSSPKVFDLDQWQPQDKTQQSRVLQTQKIAKKVKKDEKVTSTKEVHGAVSKYTRADGVSIGTKS